MIRIVVSRMSGPVFPCVCLLPSKKVHWQFNAELLLFISSYVGFVLLFTNLSLDDLKTTRRVSLSNCIRISKHWLCGPVTNKGSGSGIG